MSENLPHLLPPVERGDLADLADLANESRDEYILPGA